MKNVKSSREAGSGFARQTSKVKCQAGQTLIEVLLALGIGVAIIAAVTGAVIVALNNAGFSKNQNLANAFAQESMEVLREIRDRSWAEFDSLSTPSNRCLAQNSKTLALRLGANCAGEGDIFVGGTHFIRAVIINKNHSNCKPSGPIIQNHRATVTVRWPDGRCPACAVNPNCPTGNTFCHQARIVSCFGRQSTIPAP